MYVQYALCVRAYVRVYVHLYMIRACVRDACEHHDADFQSSS